MRSLLRLAAIVLISAVLLSLPAYLLLQQELSYRGADRLVPGLAVMALSPAIAFPVFLAVLLLPAWWFGWRVDPFRASMVAAGAVLLYVCVISIYVVYVQTTDAPFIHVYFVEYLVSRLRYSVASLLAAAIVTGVVTWAVSKFLPEA